MNIKEIAKENNIWHEPHSKYDKDQRYDLYTKKWLVEMRILFKGCSIYKHHKKDSLHMNQYLVSNK